MNFFFKKEYRILKRTEFLNLSKHGKKVQNNFFIIIYSQGIKDSVRIGITVSKKVGNAVERNRIKRIIREYFRQHRHELQRILDINIIARKDVVQITTNNAYENLKRLFGDILR